MKKINPLQQFLYRSYYQDGLWDIWLGLCLIILGFGFYLFQKFEEPIAEMFATFAYIALVYITFRGLAGVLRWAKKTYTHPRSGYIKFKPREKKSARKAKIIRVMIVILVMMLINTVSMFFVGEWVVDLFRWTLISSGLAGVLVWIGAQFNIKRYYVSAGLLFIGGVITGLMVESHQQIIFYYLFTGGVMILTGAMQLIRFLYTTKSAIAADDDEGADNE